MTETITANFEDLFRQGPMTAREYMRKAISSINDTLGEGYAEQHPELIAAFMQTAVIDLQGAVLAQQVREGIQEAAERISGSITNISISQ